MLSIMGELRGEGRVRGIAGLQRGSVGRPFLQLPLVGNNSPVLKVIVAVREYKLNDRANGPESREQLLPRGVSNSRNADRSLTAYERDYLGSLLRSSSSLKALSYAYRESCRATTRFSRRFALPLSFFLPFSEGTRPTRVSVVRWCGNSVWCIGNTGAR